VRPRPRWRRILKWTSITLAIVLVIAAAGVAADLYYLDHRVKHEIYEVPAGTHRPTKVATKAENFVLIGSDTRQGASGKGTGGSQVQGARSDTTIILHIAADNRGATLISIPRDSYVQIPSCVIGPNGQTSQPTAGKFNEAFSIGSNAGAKYGPSCTVHTIETLTGISIDHYAVIDFAGFRSMVDALGGVRMCVAKPLYDPVHYDPTAGVNVGSDLNLPAGPNVRIDGQQALDLMRARYALDGGGDLPRIKRQQQFIAAMIRKATSSGLLVHPFQLQKFLTAATGALTTDGFGLGTMKQLADALHSEGAGKVRLLTVPNNPEPPGPLSADVAWDPVKAPELWNAIIHDQPIPGSKTSSPSPSSSASPTPTTSPLSVQPADITINVLNGSGVTGAAAKAAAALDTEGFHATVGGDAASASYQLSVVEYGPTRVQSSQTVAAAVTGSTRKSDPALGSSITLIVGSNYSGVVPVTIGSSTPTPTPTATAKIPSFAASTGSCLS
jgi:LCP family protein required for cell wall assembly